MHAVMISVPYFARSRMVSYEWSRMPAHKLEFLALKWAVTEKFYDYLYGHKFTVFTDNNPQTYVLFQSKLDATGHRWLAALASLDFQIKYRPGNTNRDADALYRLPLAESDQKISSEAIRAISKAAIHSSPWADALCFNVSISDSGEVMTDPCATETRNWRAIQRNDNIIGPIYRSVMRKVQPDASKLAKDAETAVLVKEFSHLKLIGSVLCRVVNVEGDEKCQLVLPRQFREQAMRGIHDAVGHMGRDKVSSLALYYA